MTVCAIVLKFACSVAEVGSPLLDIIHPDHGRGYGVDTDHTYCSGSSSVGRDFYPCLEAFYVLVDAANSGHATNATEDMGEWCEVSSNVRISV